MASTKSVTVYTQPGCAPCGSVKALLESRKVPFVEKNVQDDLDAIRELLDLGVMSTPATVIDGEVVVGFDRERLAALLDA
jgi:glutaredoxin